MMKQNQIMKKIMTKSYHKSNNNIHSDLIDAIKHAYEPTGLVANNFSKEAESEEYGAFTFEMNNKRIKFRLAKITPTKIGQFVTLWKRIGSGPIMPYDISDAIDLFVISVRNKDHLVNLFFTKATLCEKGFVSKNQIGGKRAMRVYPPWDMTQSAQAKKTQEWQIKYFFEIYKNKNIDIPRIQNLF